MGELKQGFLEEAEKFSKTAKQLGSVAMSKIYLTSQKLFSVFGNSEPLLPEEIK